MGSAGESLTGEQKKEAAQALQVGDPLRMAEVIADDTQPAWVGL